MIQRNQLKRSVLALAIAVATSGVVFAQSSVGYIFGQTSGAGSVQVENLATGSSREVSVDADGNYRASSLAPGRYKVTFGAQSREVTVNVGTGSAVSFAAAGATLDTVEVTGAMINPIDVSSVESTTVLTEDTIDRLPVARDVTSVALLAPGTVRGDARFGNVASFGGASPAENAYFINGFNVTNILTGLAYNEAPFEAIAETQVKTGGYGAEFGRSLGGVTSVVTKSGSNDFKFGGNVFYTPESTRSGAQRRDRVGSDWFLTDSEDSRDVTVFNLHASGPILQDRLFFFVLAQGSKDEADTYGDIATGPSASNNDVTDTPQGLVKLDWNISDNHILEYTGFRDEATTERTQYSLATPYSTDRSAVTGTREFSQGGDSHILKWTGYLTDGFTMSALAGRGEYSRADLLANTDCPTVTDSRAASTVTRYGCWTGSRVGAADAGDTRESFRLDAEWLLGDHGLRFGVDREKIESIDATVSSGGIDYDVQDATPGETVAPGVTIPNGVTQIVFTREFANGGAFNTLNTAWYVEDTWQITDNFIGYLGVRNESFENRNANDLPFIKVDNTWAPRAGFAWDVKGDSSSKLFGNAGRYYIPVMANTNVRLSGAETDIQRFYVFNGTFGTDRFGLPALGPQIGATNVVSNGVAGNPLSVVDPNIEPLFQDEYILGYQQQIADLWSMTVRGVHRKMNSGMDDYCASQIPFDWAIANGFNEDEAGAIANATGHCFLMNPGSDLTANVDLQGNGQLTQVVIPAADLYLPTPTRTYNSLEFAFERAWDDKWTAQGSWTIAHSYGNSEGYVKSDIGQDDAGITQDFDFAGLTENSYGDLPNDRRHSLKVFGAYKIADEWQLGANLVVQSGRPLNCFGLYPADGFDPETQLYGPSSFYCNGEAAPRGSRGRLPWTRQLNLGVKYSPQFAEGLVFGLDILNVFDADELTVVRERGETGAGAPSVNYLRPEAWQPRRSMRFSVAYDFGN